MTKIVRFQPRGEEPARIAVEMPLPLLASLGSAERDFLALCVETGRRVLTAMMESDRTALCGPKWQPDPARSAVRAGTTPSEVTLGGRRLPIRRPRARSLDGHELALPSFLWAADRDPLDRHTLAAISRGVSTRGYKETLEALPEDQAERAVSHSAVSRRFVALSTDELRKLLCRPLRDLGLAVVMIDGIVFEDHTVLIALGISEKSEKHVLALREGATENAVVAKALLEDLIERGLPTERPLLFVIDGAKALRKAIRDIFGESVLVQRCQVHKTRNVVEHLPEAMRARVRRAMREAWELSDARLAEKRLRALAGSLEQDHPGAADSLREGLSETLTLQRLGVTGALYRTLRSTNAIENLNGGIGRYTRNVKRWQGGAMILRWVGAAVLHAERGFRRIRGYRSMERLVAALERTINHKNLDRQGKAA